MDFQQTQLLINKKILEKKNHYQQIY